MTRRSIVLGLALLVPRLSPAQYIKGQHSPLNAEERGAAALAELVRGLGVNVRVLMIGAHPDDEDTALITWLARGRQVETAYLSLTRGDGELVGSGVRFRASEPDEAIVARARRDASGQARSGDRLSVFIDGALFLEEPVALDERRAG